MNTQTFFWLALAIILGVIEASTSNLITLWPAIAALLTACFAAFGITNIWLSIIFVVLSAVLLVCTRPLVKKYVSNKTIATNADRIIGAEGIVTNRIDPIENSGQVKIMGQIWSAKSSDGKPIEENVLVSVVALEGVKAVVKEKNMQK